MELKNLSLKELENLKNEIKSEIDTRKLEMQKREDFKLVSAIEEYLNGSPTEDYTYIKYVDVAVNIQNALFAIAQHLKSCH